MAASLPAGVFIEQSHFPSSAPKQRLFMRPLLRLKLKLGVEVERRGAPDRSFPH
jgi:hypothetical protein